MAARKRAPKAADEVALRYAAEIHYTMHPTAITLEDLARHEMFSQIPKATLQGWHDQDHWQHKRQAHLDKLRHLLQSKMTSRLLHMRLEQIDDMEMMWEQGMSLMCDPKLQPKGGWEGVAQVMLSIGKSLDSWRVGVAQELTPETVQSQAASPQMTLQQLPEICEDEARAAARAIVEMRRKKTQGSSS